MDSDLLNVGLQEGPRRTWADSLSTWKWQSRDTEASLRPGQLGAEPGLEPCPGSEPTLSPRNFQWMN